MFLFKILKISTPILIIYYFNIDICSCESPFTELTYRNIILIEPEFIAAIEDNGWKPEWLLSAQDSTFMHTCFYPYAKEWVIILCITQATLYCWGMAEHQNVINELDAAGVTSHHGRSLWDLYWNGV